MDETFKIAETPQRDYRDYIAAKLGMWLFLITEFFLFIGPFLLYSVYRYKFPQDFQSVSAGLNITLAGLNTVILLTSSITITLAISAVKKGRNRLGLILLGLTVILGVSFLLIKYLEWSAEISRGIYPGSPALLTRSSGEVIFYGLYFFMTGLHGLHIAGGIVLIKVMMLQIIRGKIHQNDYIQLENSGLYWHLVDIIWIYLFPLFYLGWMSFFANILISSFIALLVLLYLMHLRSEKGVLRLIVPISIIILFILAGMVFSDVAFR